MTKFQEGQFVISGGGDEYWHATSAKTLNGAKMIASKTYQQAVGGKIEVAQVLEEQFVRVAVKYGYDAWQQA